MSAYQNNHIENVNHGMDLGMKNFVDRAKFAKPSSKLENHKRSAHNGQLDENCLACKELARKVEQDVVR